MYMAVASAASVPSAMSRELSRNVVSGYPGSEVADGELLAEEVASAFELDVTPSQLRS